MGSPSARFAHGPLFYASGSTQRLLDGPALRSTALITYANWLLVQGNRSFVEDTMWPVIQRDLDYVATEWNQSTSVNSHKALMILIHLQHNFSVLISGRKCIHLPSLQRLYSTGPFARVRRLRHNLTMVPPLTRTTLKLPISSVSSRYPGYLPCFSGLGLTVHVDLLEPDRRLHHGQYGRRSVREGLKHYSRVHPHMGHQCGM